MNRAVEVYTDNGAAQPSKDRYNAPFKRQLEAVKSGVRIEQVAAEYGEFRLADPGRLLGRCISPDHEDRTPSLTINVEEQRFKCFGIGCGEYGDVLDFVMLAEGGVLWEAMISLSTRYGIELPGKRAAWFARQERQRPIRNAIHEARVYAARKKLYRGFFEPLVLATDAEDRAHDEQLFWEATLPLAERLVARMMEGRS